MVDVNPESVTPASWRRMSSPRSGTTACSSSARFSFRGPRPSAHCAQASQYAAEAGLVLENPQSQSLLDAPSGDELRYVADQVAILKSVAVADRASALLKKAGEGPFNARQVQRETTIGSNADSNYILVRCAAGNPTTASACANAIVRAYRELIREDLARNANGSLQRLDAAIADTKDEALLSELRGRRTRILVNAKLAGDGVGLFSPAGLGKAQGVSWLSALAIAVVLGARRGRPIRLARKQAFSNWLARLCPRARDFEILTSRASALRQAARSPLSGTESAEAFRLLASSVSRCGTEDRSSREPATDERTLRTDRIQVGCVRRRRVRDGRQR
jgi:hypothetical protein